jgi:glycosyltransferase involved in cell wall biosynthesis
MDEILTVSIAAYNVEKTLSGTLDSIVKQDVRNRIKVIIVDDGSSDRTAEIADSYKNEYPEIISVVHQENGGYGATINASLKIANTRYYKLLDGDDFFTENLPEYLDFLESCTADLVLSPYYLVSGNNEELVSNHKNINGVADIQHDIVMHEIAVRTDALRALNTAISTHCFYTDNEFVLYCLLASRTYAIFEKPIYEYMVGVVGQSVSREGVLKHYKDTITVADKICELYENYKGTLSAEQEVLVDRKVYTVIKNVYGAFLLIDEHNNKLNELIRYDKSLKERYPEEYHLSMEHKKIKLLRTSKFILYGYLCKRERRRVEA